MGGKQTKGPREHIAKMAEIHRKERLGGRNPGSRRERFGVGGGVRNAGRSHRN